jgi:hypothetical protein
MKTSTLTSPVQVPHETATKCPVTKTLNFFKRLIGRQPTAPSAWLSKDPVMRCPVLNRPASQSSEFIEKAAAEAKSASILPGDPLANACLQKARDHIYHWPRDFKGFECHLSIVDDSKEYHLDLTAHSSRKYEFKNAQEEFPDASWLRYQIEEMLSHREAPSISQMSSRTGVMFGDFDPVYGPQLIFQGDKMKSYYRILHNKITQISRSYGSQTFVINIDDHLTHNDHYAARCYNAFYYCAKTGDFRKVETFFDEYQVIESLALPLERRYTSAGINGKQNRALRFNSISLL